MDYFTVRPSVFLPVTLECWCQLRLAIYVLLGTYMVLFRLGCILWNHCPVKTLVQLLWMLNVLNVLHSFVHFLDCNCMVKWHAFPALVLGLLLLLLLLLLLTCGQHLYNIPPIDLDQIRSENVVQYLVHSSTIFTILLPRVTKSFQLFMA